MLTWTCNLRERARAGPRFNDESRATFVDHLIFAAESLWRRRMIELVCSNVTILSLSDRDARYGIRHKMRPVHLSFASINEA